MQKYAGKKILILGSSTGAVELVRYAQLEGAYVLVADYCEKAKSPAKLYANECIDVSTADTDALESIIRQKGIDCVYSGISEFNLVQAMRLSERCGLPFYCKEEQWNKVADKESFRRLCELHQVPCPKTFFSGASIPDDICDSLEYPVVVKPVDSSSSVGVTICSSRESVSVAISLAREAAKSKKIIIEEFVSGVEFTAHYTIYKGKASLSCIDNHYPTAIHDGCVTTIPAGRIYPSLYIDIYIDRVNNCIIDMCESLGIQYGVVFVQGIYDQVKGTFAIFEGALRGAGECPYRFIDYVSGLNYSTMLLDAMLLGDLPEEVWPDDPYMAGKSCGVVSYVAKHGTVGEITGLEEARATPDVIAIESRYPVGSTTPDGDTLHQLMLRFFLVCENRESMAQDVRQINEIVDVYNTDREDMVLKFDPERLSGLR